MKTLRKTILTAVLALAASLAFTTAVSSAGIVDQAVPLKLKVVTADGKKRIKVAKKLPVLVSCSKDCSFKTTVTLITPATSDPKSISGNLPAGNILTLRYRLTSYGVRYVKRNVSGSKLKVKFSAKDTETGERVIKSRTFRFYK
ncbi:MAG TPA: hypothetical protein VMF31_05385 [Solirubrobacterales bacterium]|nr:hypothetical protein [Solirubrobacterales bacterium]